MLPNNYTNLFAQSFSFWDYLSDNEKENLCQNTMLAKYPKGTIHNGNDGCIGILLVKSGQLRTYLLSEDGRDITIYRLLEGDVFILSAPSVLSAITFDLFIDAVETSELLLINPPILGQLIEQNIYVKCYCYELITSCFSKTIWTMEQILFMGVDKRLAGFLLNEYNQKKSHDIKLTHEQIAKYIGSAREVVSRMLKYFEQEGIVKLSRGDVTIIDTSKLYQIVG